MDNTHFSQDGSAINHQTGEHRRLWGDKEKTIQTFVWMSELWEEIRHVAYSWRRFCTLEADTSGVKGTCEMVEEHIIESLIIKLTKLVRLSRVITTLTPALRLVAIWKQDLPTILI